MPIIEPDVFNLVLDPNEVSIERVQLFLNVGGGVINIDQAGIDWGDVAIQAFLADQKVGSSSVDHRIPNRLVNVPLGIGVVATQAEFDQARRALIQKVALIQRENGWLKRGTDMYADVIDATVNIPDQWGEVAAWENSVKLTLECKPDFFGPEIQIASISATDGCLSEVLQTGDLTETIYGDYPGRLRIVINNTGSHQQRMIIGGLRSLPITGIPALEVTTNDLIYEVEDLTLAPGGVITADGGASGISKVRVTSIPPAWTNVCTLSIAGGGHLTHVGTYRVWARVQEGFSTIDQMRLVWGIGDLTTPTINDPVDFTLGQAVWGMVDLGQITIQRSIAGPQVWTGQIQAYGTSSGTLDLDQVFLQPLNEYAWKCVSSDTNPSDVVIDAPNKQCEIRWDGAARAAAVGYKPVTVFGDLPRLPVSYSELELRDIQLFLKMWNGTNDTPPKLYRDPNLDDFTVDVFYRPCYLTRS